MKTILASVLVAATMLVSAAHAATTATFDDAANQNPNHYVTPDGLYSIEAFGADVNSWDYSHGAPVPSMGVPVPYNTVSPMDMGVAVRSWQLGLYFQWDEVTIFGDLTYGTEYWIHARDLDDRDIFVLHGIVQGVKIVQTPKADAEIGQLWILMKPAATSPSTVGRYGAVDNIKLRAKGEKPLSEQKPCTRRRGC